MPRQRTRIEKPGADEGHQILEIVPSHELRACEAGGDPRQHRFNRSETIPQIPIDAGCRRPILPR